MDNNVLIEEIKMLGADGAAVFDTEDLAPDSSVREKKCAGCASYGFNYACPPWVPEPDECAAIVSRYRRAAAVWLCGEKNQLLVRRHAVLMAAVSQCLRDRFGLRPERDFLVLGAGACPLCEKCTAAEYRPCRQKDKYLMSMEAFGINLHDRLPESDSVCGLVLFEHKTLKWKRFRFYYE